MSPQVVIYTDGACSGNPGPGGWGAILIYGDKKKELKGGEPATTNNRMELMAAIQALEALTKPCKVELHTDSQYVQKGIHEWIHGWKRRGWLTADKKPVKNDDLWKRRGWKTADNKPVKNDDLWRRLDEARSRHNVTWRWVKGHAGHELNERADALARQGLRDTVEAASG